jgi:hypothetical protein
MSGNHPDGDITLEGSAAGETEIIFRLFWGRRKGQSRHSASDLIRRSEILGGILKAAH